MNVTHNPIPLFSFCFFLCNIDWSFCRIVCCVEASGPPSELRLWEFCIVAVSREFSLSLPVSLPQNVGDGFSGGGLPGPCLAFWNLWFFIPPCEFCIFDTPIPGNWSHSASASDHTAVAFKKTQTAAEWSTFANNATFVRRTRHCHWRYSEDSSTYPKLNRLNNYGLKLRSSSDHEYLRVLWARLSENKQKPAE